MTTVKFLSDGGATIGGNLTLDVTSIAPLAGTLDLQLVPNDPHQSSPTGTVQLSF